MTERLHATTLCRCLRSSSRCAGTSSKVSLTLDKLEAVSNNLGCPMFVTVFSVIAADLQATLYESTLPFGETVSACFSLFTPNYYGDKIGFSLAFLIGKRSVYCKSKLAHNLSGISVAHFRIPS